MLNHTSAPKTDPGNKGSDQELEDFAKALGAESAKDVRDQYDK